MRKSIADYSIPRLYLHMNKKNKMSFVDLATLTLHRRHELESRIHIFDEKCDRAIKDIKVLKMKTKGFVSELNCDPSELKERFLNVMQKLDEYMYLITDFNLAMAQTADTVSTETPIQDSPNPPPSLSPFNLIDALSDPLTTNQANNLAPCPQPRSRTLNQALIQFSSSSSAESVPKRSEEVQYQLPDVASLAIQEPVQPASVAPSTSETEYNHRDCCITAAQSILEIDQEYPATIICVDRYSFWVITEDPAKVSSFMSEMTDYYMKNKKQLSASELEEMTYCAYCEGGVYYRAMFLQKPEGKTVHVYVVDTGEMRVTSTECVQPLAKRFCDRPPYARLCHLAGLDFGENINNKDLIRAQEEFMKKYNSTQCNILVDDNSSESIGVYVMLASENTTLNELMVVQGLAIPIDRGFLGIQKLNKVPEAEASPAPRHGPPPEHSEDEWNITQCPEYEDPVIAVTGYHNRDEADICKHYKGGPEKTCFKGTRCTKKHILHHPDGWTMDKVEVIAKCESVPLPAPGTWHKVLVTAVCHYDRVFVQIMSQDKAEEELPIFGLVLPPMTLQSLQRDMNVPATVQAYKTLSLVPATGEIVAAIYPPDNRWYRARVLTVTRLDQSVEVMYVDYGTVLWVKEDQIRELPSRFARLPQQAVQCALAGVRVPSEAHWPRATRALAALVSDATMHAHIIAREYDEVIVELFTYEDPDDPTRGQNVADLLAQRGIVELTEYGVVDDVATNKLVLP